MVSFDGCSLFPSEPISKSSAYLVDLPRNNPVTEDEVYKYVSHTNLCVKHNYFQIEGKFHEQEIAMGNELLPFLPNLFMNPLQTEIKKGTQYCHRIRLRYADDVFAAFGMKSLIFTIPFSLLSYSFRE